MAITTVDGSFITDNTVDGTKLALASQAAGDVMYYNGTDWIRLAKGTADQILTMNDGATAPGWETAAAGGTAPVFGRVKRTSADVTTTSTSLVDFTGASITFTTGAFPIMYGQIATSRNSTAGAMIAYNVLIDSTLELGTTGIATDHYPANYNADYSFTGQSAALSAASHTIKLQWRVSAGTGLGNADTGYAHIFWAHEIR